MNRIAILLVCGLMLLACSKSAEATIVVDDFSVEQEDMSIPNDPNPSTQEVSGPATSIFGSFRESRLQRFGGTVSLEIDNGDMSLYNQQSNSSDGEFALIYDGAGTGALGTGIDVTEGGVNTFLYVVGAQYTAFANSPDFLTNPPVLSLFVTLASGDDSFTHEWTINSGLDEDLKIALSVFAAEGVDLTSIDRIAISGTLDPPGFSASLNMDAIVIATPEPASLVTLGLGALGLFCYGRRQRRKANRA